MENTEGQTSEEVAWGQITCHWPDGKSSTFCKKQMWVITFTQLTKSNYVFKAKKKKNIFKKLQLTLEETRDIFQLRDVVLPTFTVFGQQWQVLQVFPAGVGGVQLVKLPVHNTPSLDFFLGELDIRNGIPTGTKQREFLKFQVKTKQTPKITIKYPLKRTVCKPWQDQQSTFSFSDRHCPWNPGEQRHTKDLIVLQMKIACIWKQTSAGLFESAYRMVCIQLRAIHQDTVSALVQVRNFLWEPRYIVHIWE